MKSCIYVISIIQVISIKKKPITREIFSTASDSQRGRVAHSRRQAAAHTEGVTHAPAALRCELQESAGTASLSLSLSLTVTVTLTVTLSLQAPLF